MTRWVKQLWRRLRQEDVIETLAHDLDGARRVMHFDAGERGNLKKEIATLREQVRRLEAEPDRLAQMLARRTQERDAAQMKLNAYLDGVPATHAEMSWTKEDQAQLADFLEHKPAGKKLAQHLANRVQDYQVGAILSPPALAAAANARARGFRDCRGELRRLSAAGPSPANHVAPDIALPDDLENLRA